MPWLHKSKKATRVESGDCAAAKCGKIPYTSRQQQQQQQQQPKCPQDELQSALHNVLEALQNLTEKRQQRSPSPRLQQSALQFSETIKDHQRRSSSQEKKKVKKKQQQQQQEQPQPLPPQISSAECDDAFRNLQLYLSRISSRQFESSPAGPVTASIVQSDSTFATDQLDPPSSASQLRRRNYRPTRRQLMLPEADLVSGLTSEDLQASEGSREDDDQPKLNVVTEGENASSIPVRRFCKSKVSEIDLTPERVRPISSSLLQPPSTIALGCSIVTHYFGDGPSQHQNPATVLLLCPTTSTVRPPIKALNLQLPPCDQDCSCSSRTKSLIIDEEVRISSVPNLATEPCVVEAADKSVNCSAVHCSTAVNTCADGDSISDTSTTFCSTAHAAAETADQDDSVNDNKNKDEDSECGSKDEEVGNAVGVNSNNSVYRTGCCHHNNHRQPNPLQMHSVVESKLLERACESFPPAEEELAAPSNLNAIDWEPPRFGKVEMRLEQPRPAEPIGQADNQGVSGGDSVSRDGSGLRSSSTMRSATTLELLDNVNDDVECDSDAGVEANEDSSTAMSSCCTYDIGKSSGFTRLLLTLDRAHRRLEGLPPSALPPPSGDTLENPALPAAQHQLHLNRQRASVQTLNKMLLRSPFVSRRERTPPPQEKHQPDNRHPVEQAAHPGCWTSQPMMHQQMTCQPMTSDPDSVIVTTATSLMTLSQSLQRCVLQLEAAVSRLNGNFSS